MQAAPYLDSSSVETRGNPRLTSLVLLLATALGCRATGTLSDAEAAELRPLLTSERIERRYGSFGIDVLVQEGGLRLSRLYSGRGDEKVTRTLALVELPTEVDDELREPHERILAGGSIGAVLSDAGWTVRKEPLFFGRSAQVDASADVAELVGSPEGKAVHVYELHAQRNDVDVFYARIVEVHHPSYLTVEDLERLYPRDFAGHTHPTAAAARSISLLLRAAGSETAARAGERAGLSNLEENPQLDESPPNPGHPALAARRIEEHDAGKESR